jgi:hypothetical protein
VQIPFLIGIANSMFQKGTSHQDAFQTHAFHNGVDREPMLWVHESHER